MSVDIESTDENQQSTITKETVEARVEDWKKRLHDLYKKIISWADKNGWQVDKNGTVYMHEELMKTFHIPPTEQPVLRLDKDSGYALFKPKGLWVIGANGRIDLYTSKGTFIILDIAEPFTSSNWTIFKVTENHNGDFFTPEMLPEIV